ncbi:hypothetical protein Tco_1006980 [Tanacetum coccineum]|uniref:Uncharacterized protein n=1 Tax=Tanacetum coccineum TaxID=301880 RepID=A0ABQ5FL52_9ASTR
MKWSNSLTYKAFQTKSESQNHQSRAAQQAGLLGSRPTATWISAQTPPGFGPVEVQPLPMVFQPKHRQPPVSSQPAHDVHLARQATTAPFMYDQETSLPLAFSTMTVQDPNSGNSDMRICASSHFNSYVNNLSTILNTYIYPSVLV